MSVRVAAAIASLMLFGCEQDNVEATSPLATRAHDSMSPHAALARAADGTLYFAYGNNLEQLSATGSLLQTLDQLPLGVVVHSITTNPQGSLAWVSQVEVDSQRRTGVLTVLSNDSRYSRDVACVDAPLVLAPDDDIVFVAERTALVNASGSVARFSDALELESRIDVGWGRFAPSVAADDEHLFVLDAPFSAASSSQETMVRVHSLPLSADEWTPLDLPGEPIALASTPSGVRVVVAAEGSLVVYDTTGEKVGTIGALPENGSVVAMNDRYAYTQASVVGTDEEACTGGTLARVDLSTGQSTDLDSTICTIYAAIAYDDCVMFVETMASYGDEKRWPYKLKRICDAP